MFIKHNHSGTLESDYLQTLLMLREYEGWILIHEKFAQKEL